MKKNFRGVYNSLSLKQRRAIAKAMKFEAQEYGNDFVELHHQGILTTDRNGKSQKLIKVWRNRKYLVQLYRNGGWLRLSINRAEYDPEGDCWLAGISWDDLMRIKAGVGFGDQDAIEIYPADDDIVNVTNMRHLFLVPDHLKKDLTCIWRK